MEVHTPLNIAAWQACLRGHPDADFTEYILRGLQCGFRIGVSGPTKLQSAKTNMSSAKQHPEVIEHYLQSEIQSGNILGPFPPQSLVGLHINRFGTIPKKHQPGKWRLITDLSFPEGASVNNAIDPTLCSLSYVTVDEVATAAIQLGQGALLAKIDIKSAYRLLPVHPSDRMLLGMQWRGAEYVDGMLPFGLRSAPKIFNAVADALEWCVAQKQVHHIFHYLDDFVVLGPPESSICMESLQKLEKVCQHLGVPLAPEKKDGPAQVLVFLGIIIDTRQGELRLPSDKLHRLIDEVDKWLSKRACTRRELESLIGTLHYACKVIRPGRSFLRRAISLLSIVKQRHHHIRLNAEFRSDMMWWKMFATCWNGTAIIIPKGPPDATITSDASGSWGCGAWYGSKWFQLQWPDNMRSKNIAVKELIPIIIATLVWGPDFAGKRLLASCDNAAVVSVLSSRYSRDKDLMQMLRCLFFIEAYYHFSLSAHHIAGTRNVWADDLSRNRLAAFKTKVPHADPYPTPLPPPLLQWLINPNLDWTSPSWMQQLTIFVKRE